MSEAKEVNRPAWWKAMLTPDGQRDLRVLGDMQSSLKDVADATRRIEDRKHAAG